MGGNNLSGASTRLDGLIALLDSGSNSAVRKMAANQIGDLVAAHPSETRPVLRRVRRLLRSPVWDTRVAAGIAIAAIADSSPRFVPQPDQLPIKQQPSTHVKSEPHKVEPLDPSIFLDQQNHSPTSILSTGLRFHTLDIDKLMDGGAMLFGSSGDEYKSAEMDVAAQRARLKADLGLDDRFSNASDMLGLKDEDLIAKQSSPNLQRNQPSLSADIIPTADVVAEMSGPSGLSARERNRLKRAAKKRSRKGSSMGLSRPPKRPRAPGEAANGEPDGAGAEEFSLSQMAKQSNDEDEEFERAFAPSLWDFQPTCEALKQGLLEPCWEWRHGAALGLRQILMRHAQSAGRSKVGSEGDEENARWLEDVCCRLLCVLAMDRFGDFVGDAVVAPVRETAAMTIGASSRAMSNQNTLQLVNKIFYLLKTRSSSQWEVRHAALLGIRYVLASKDSMVVELLALTFSNITEGLRDQDDDVRAIAAEALLPVATKIMSCQPHTVPGLVTILWEALLDLDDISASTSSVLRLLSEITNCPSQSGFNRLWLEPDMFTECSDEDIESTEEQQPRISRGGDISPVLVELVPRLWPFLRHSSKSVRRAAVTLLEKITAVFPDEELLVWARPLCTEMLTRLFRNILLETQADIIDVSRRVWTRLLKALGTSQTHAHSLPQIVGPLLLHWLQVSSHETRSEAGMYDETQNKTKATPAARRRTAAAAARRAEKAKKAKNSGSAIPQTAHDGDSATVVEGPYDAVKMQQNAAAALGLLAVFWPVNDLTFQSHLSEALQGPYATSRRVASDICGQWAVMSNSSTFGFNSNIGRFLEAEVEGRGNCPIAEVGVSAGSFFSDSLAFIDTIPPPIAAEIPAMGSMRQSLTDGKKSVSGRDYPTAAHYALAVKPHMTQLVTGDAWEYLVRSLRNGGIQKRRLESFESLRMRILSSIGYMGVREESNKISLAASATTSLVSAPAYPLPLKVGPFIKSLMAALKTSKNPHLQEYAANGLSRLALRLSTRESKKPLSLMLKNLTKHLTADQTLSDKSILKSMDASVEVELDGSALAKRGAVSAFQALCRVFKGDLFVQLPWLWSRLEEPFKSSDFKTPSREVIEALIVLRFIVGYIDAALHAAIGSLLAYVIKACAAPHAGFAEYGPSCLADTVAAIPGEGMQNVVSKLVPLLSGTEREKESDRCSRRGAATTLRAVVSRMGTDLIPYAAFMVVPMMTRMVDEDEVVRDASAEVFGTLVRLMPLEGGAPDDPTMSENMAAEREEARKFLGQLLGTEPRSHYELPVSIGDGITLRKYQQECLDWLAFLNRYGLHGALCDDMGLGKTLMTLCMITGDYVTLSKNGACYPSLVVCPSTIVAHWVQEAERFFGSALQGLVHYAGPPKARARMRQYTDFHQASLIVTSYEVLSNDLRYFENLKWNYVALDEGHVIKNPKTRVAKAVRALSASHRLILTGTPIQNSVLELWSIFDFLMPGFLGSERSFKESYSKPIMASQDQKCSEADQEKGMVATEALHRQVLPFVLRRLKDDVLAELPPKIMQDYHCNMTRLQKRLYQEFARDIADGDGVPVHKDDGSSGKSSHVFKALAYMRRLCSHPKLVLKNGTSLYDEVQEDLHAEGKSINDIDSSAKLVGLMNILQECGIGTVQSSARDSGGHRVLIFAQLKAMLDLVETDLFSRHMPEVTYLRLDGSVETSKRQSIVTRFNADPTIDCLLLTTQVGGLGLNLTGADTVIFLEHDWNPTRDLQAMDRAHRMGQKRTVNVYRLITRGTLEEKIMSMQKFKTHIANTVVNRENSNLQSMNTEQLLELFNVEHDDDNDGDENCNADASMGTGKGMKAALAGLDELWGEDQYEEEFNVDGFRAGMGVAGPSESSS